MIKLVKLTALLLLNASLSSAFAADVVNVSKETFAQYGKEDAYWEVIVSCEGSDIQRTVQRKTDKDTWCPKGNNSLCSEDKSIAYKNACNATYSAELQNALIEKRKIEQAQTERREQQARLAAQQRAAAQKQQNQIALEERLLSLEQQRLSLSKQQLKIENRISEIDEILENEDDDDDE